MRKGFLGLLVLCVFARAGSAHGAAINLIVNGSFEDPFVSVGSTCGPFPNCIGFHNGVPGNDNIGGWQLIGKGGIDGSGNPIPLAPPTILLLGYDYAELDGATGQPLHFHPQEGRQSVDLTGEGNQGTTNGIKQSVGTQPGTNYLLSFWLGSQYRFAPGYTEGPGALALYIDGQIIGAFFNTGNTSEDVTWSPFNYRFTAYEPQTVIAFLNDTPVGNNYAGLDNVSLYSVPEPASLLLAAAGIVLLGLRLRHKG